MLRVACLLVAGVLGSGRAEAAAPSLADGFSGVGLTEEAADRMELARERYFRGRRQHVTGNLAAVTGVVAAPVGLGMLVAGAMGQDDAVAVTGFVIAVGGGVAAIGGTILSNVGALAASRAVRDGLGTPIDRTPGYVGISVLAAGLLLAPATTGVSAAIGALGGVGLGILQMSLANRPLRDAGLLAVVPTPDGLAIAGRF